MSASHSFSNNVTRSASIILSLMQSFNKNWLTCENHLLFVSVASTRGPQSTLRLELSHIPPPLLLRDQSSHPDEVVASMLTKLPRKSQSEKITIVSIVLFWYKAFYEIHHIRMTLHPHSEIVIILRELQCPSDLLGHPPRRISIIPLRREVNLLGGNETHLSRTNREQIKMDVTSKVVSRGNALFKLTLSSSLFSSRGLSPCDQ
jgi:hypothetical protein